MSGSLGPHFPLRYLTAGLFLLVAAAEAVDIQQCGVDFKNNQTSMLLYGYHGPTFGEGLGDDVRAGGIVITEAGCKTLCGTGSDFYDWKTVASTITTWILPIISIIAQAPFESNAKRRTFLAVVRWIGSPIASLSAILWNIKASAKCAMLVDMSVPYDSFPAEGSTFAHVRDSFYILEVMNQFSIDPNVDAIVGERLLRIALFSNDITLPEKGSSLIQKRQALAVSLREGRRRGIVAVYVSLLWFLSSLAISIVDAFGSLGENVQAHDLALGLLLSWVPVLILTSIVDRNPVTADELRRRLNGLINSVREALFDGANRQVVIDQSGGWSDDLGWLKSVQDDARYSEFLQQFAGQGRVRMHYGVAHPILSSLDASYVGEQGRHWLRHEYEAIRCLAYGRPSPKGLFSFDPREFWQILSSIIVVDGVISGAFVLSYLTPTVGLGCRSGGYMISMIITGTLLVAEMLVWWATSRHSHIRKHAEPVFRLAETVSTSWLLYIVIAQTVGLYRTCSCISSTWGGGGGYVDFQTEESYRAHGVIVYWGIGTAIPCAIMVAGFAFIVAEWCEQSHLSTLDYIEAMNGLRATRRWKRLTIYFRHIPDRLIEMVKWAVRRKGRRSLVWTKDAAPIRKHVSDTSHVSA